MAKEKHFRGRGGFIELRGLVGEHFAGRVVLAGDFEGGGVLLPRGGGGEGARKVGQGGRVHGGREGGGPVNLRGREWGGGGGKRIARSASVTTTAVFVGGG